MKKQELKRKIIALNVLVLAAMQCLFAQDIHFSQFLNAPLLVNPAHAGIFNGDYRAGINYKGQWSSVTNAYQTMAAGVDMPVFFKKQKSRKVNYLTAGITAYTDRAGTSKMSTTAVNGIVGYNLKISKYNNVSAAINGGMVQRSISINKLKWDQQYDGNTYHPDVSSGEFFSSRAFYFADIGAGLFWRLFIPEKDFRCNTGISIGHFPSPHYSFLSNNSERLYNKIQLHNEIMFRLPRMPLVIVPQVWYVMQGPARELMAGIQGRYIIGYADKSEILYTEKTYPSAVIAGLYYRKGDAICMMVGFEYKRALQIGISYDSNISGLRVASMYRGGMELSLIYKGVWGNSVFSNR